MPRLRVLAGPSLDTLKPIQPNSGIPFKVRSEAFEGEVLVYIKGFENIEVGDDGNGGDGDVRAHAGVVVEDRGVDVVEVGVGVGEGDGGKKERRRSRGRSRSASGSGRSSNAYFEQKERKGVTWSIQAQGRFLQPHSADDIMFGNVFERPLKLPWGFGAALKFMKYIDPTLEHDLTSRTKPWALSPLIATMPHLIRSQLDPSHSSPSTPAFPPPKPILEDDRSLPSLLSLSSQQLEGQNPGSNLEQQNSILSWPNGNKKKGGRKGGGGKMASRRKSFFKSRSARESVTFGSEDILTMDFCYEYLHFKRDGIELRLPGITIDMLRYWDGQPVHFVCCERGSPSSTGAGGSVPWGRVFWCVVVELAEEK